IPELEVMDEDRHIEEVLDKFVNCHEQTYEEFLSAFTHLSKDNVTKRGAFGTNSSENNFTSVKFTQRNEPNDHHLSNKAIFLCTSSHEAKAHWKKSKQREEIVGDGVRPFSLDEEFDYDAVMLIPKFTPAETDAIKELCKQKSKSTDLEKPRD
ncbi:hypothetical protein E2I00_001870, partial [Balaenoptera physalus]